MRVTLIVPALFALSLVGGTALAEHPGHDHSVREPKMDVVRQRGDMVDRYDHTSIPTPSSSERTSSQSQPAQHMAGKLDSARTHGDLVDHTYASTSAPTKSTSQHYAAISYTHTPQAVKPQQERQNCSTAQDDCAANRSNKFQGGHETHLTKSSKSDRPGYAWKAEDPAKKADAQSKNASSSMPSSLTAAQAATLARLVKAKMCQHAASQDGCGGGED